MYTYIYTHTADVYTHTICRYICTHSDNTTYAFGWAGAMRFINHCLEDSEPNVRALILNHYGVPHVSLYAGMCVLRPHTLVYVCLKASYTRY